MTKIYLPDYPWSIIKDFMLRKVHPSAKLLKLLSERYLRPQIFMSNYFLLKNGMFVKVDRPELQMKLSISSSVKFIQYVRMKGKSNLLKLKKKV